MHPCVSVSLPLAALRSVMYIYIYIYLENVLEAKCLNDRRVLQSVCCSVYVAVRCRVYCRMYVAVCCRVYVAVCCRVCVAE